MLRFVAVILPALLSGSVHAQYRGMDVPTIPSGPSIAIPSVPDLGRSYVRPGIDNTRIPDVPPVPSAGGAGGGGRSPAPSEQYFVIAVCAAANDPTPGCLSKSLREARDKLVEMYVEAYRNGVARAHLRLIFPTWLDRAEQFKHIRDLNKKAVEFAIQVMRADVATLTPYDWRVEQERRLNEWALRATKEADAGGGSKEESSQSHVFGSSPALEQLKHINISGWGKN